jgi:PPOX class probable F420-dependent enzyme
MTLTDAETEFLRSHRWALVATTRRNGAPQVSMVAYHFDGADIVMSIRKSAAKWANTARQPEVVVTVADDQSYVSVAGRADRIASDPDREQLTRRVLASLKPQHASLLQADIDRGLDVAGRVVLRVLPMSAVGRC